jgi:acetoin utilization deacetylase AcuC-like enzyme
MLPFKLIYSDDYSVPMGEHIFPIIKYRKIRQRLLDSGVATPQDFVAPEMPRDEDILLVHTKEYIDKLVHEKLSPAEIALMELPYSLELLRMFYLAAGGSIMAAQLALEGRIGFNLGGGFHHAFPDHGEGFCAIHDVAIAIRKLQKEGTLRKAMTVDCDVHQGNGTAAIFARKNSGSAPMPSHAPLTVPAQPTQANDDQDVFTISLHQEHNYPQVKPPSSIDVNLPDGTGDTDYLQWLDNALSSGLRKFTPELICYIAGADPYKEDQLGGLGMTIEGLKQRDALVFKVCKARNIPVMVTYAGGYARNVEDTVTIHCNTVVAAKEVFSS